MREIIIMGDWHQETAIEGIFLVSDDISHEEIREQWINYKSQNQKYTVDNFMRETCGLLPIKKDILYLNVE